MSQPLFVIEEVTDPVEVERFRAQMTQHKRNSDWLASHWPDLLPQARGKVIAVAGREAFVADTPEEAVAQAAAHPDDKGVLVQFVVPHPGPRFSAPRG
jgi:hypothetical protein